MTYIDNIICDQHADQTFDLHVSLLNKIICIYTFIFRYKLSINTIFILLHSWICNTPSQDKFLIPSADNQTSIKTQSTFPCLIVESQHSRGGLEKFAKTHEEWRWSFF